MICPPESKGVRMVLLSKTEGSWSETEVFLHTVDDIRDSVGVGMKTTQVNLSRNMKVFYCLGNAELMDDPKIQAKVTDMEGTVHYMVSPILLCECNDFRPIDLSKEIEETIKSTIDFC